jgi:hypothetical protein
MNHEIIIFRGAHHVSSSSSQLRVIYYLTMAILQDEDVQKKGLVNLVFALQPQPPIKDSMFSFNLEAVAAATYLRNVLPARYVASHYCFTQDSFLSYVNWEQQCYRKGSRPPSACLHHASTMELFFDLQRFGISPSCAPVNVFGTEIKVCDHQEWLESQKFKELLENWAGPREDDFFSCLPEIVLDDSEAASMEQNSVDPAPLRCPIPPQLVQNPISSDQLQNAPIFMCGKNDNAWPVGSNDTIFQSNGTYNATAQLIGQCQDLVDRLQKQKLQQQKLPQQTGAVNQCPVLRHQKSELIVKNQIAKFDVLFGRGKVKDHYGNIYLHQLIAMKQGRYEAAERWEKTIIAEEIISIIRDRGGRFLKPSKVKTNETWTEVDAETAREKVSHTFRSRRPKLNISSNLLSTTSRHR